MVAVITMVIAMRPIIFHKGSAVAATGAGGCDDRGAQQVCRVTKAIKATKVLKMMLGCILFVMHKLENCNRNDLQAVVSRVWLTKMKLILQSAEAAEDGGQHQQHRPSVWIVAWRLSRGRVGISCAATAGHWNMLHHPDCAAAGPPWAVCYTNMLLGTHAKTSLAGFT